MSSAPLVSDSLSPRWAAVALVVAVFAIYANSFTVPFVFDDVLSVVENPTIRHLWPPAPALSPPSGQGLTVEGRPVANLSLAVNYALSGVAPWSYHAVNVTIHALAALALLGLIRRTLLYRANTFSASRDSRSPTLIAFSAALLWAVHPLQTESVTYVVQRTESLMGLFYLLTLYCFVRGASAYPADTETRPTTSARWQTLAVVACALGMATKEVMVTAPLVVLLYDRTFISGSFRAAWRRHARLYLALATTWLLLAALVVGSGNRGGTIGGASGVGWWQFALSQSHAVVHYVRLAFWPAPLIFDYGPHFLTLAEAAPYLLTVAILLALTAVALARRPALGFAGAWFFVILSPTSSVVGGTRQMIVEHRMYLSLAAIAVLAAVVLQKCFGRHFWLATVIAASVLGTATVVRNTDYASELALYRDTAAKRPANGFARYNLGKAYADAGRHAEALPEYEASLRLISVAAATHFNMANSLVALGRVGEARTHYEAALRIDPRSAKAHFNLGNLLVSTSEKSEAPAHFRAALAHDPQLIAARTNLGGVLLELGRLDEAQAQLEIVTRTHPDSVEAHFGLGNIFLLHQRHPEAAREFEIVLRLRPDLTLARERLKLARDGK